MKRTRRTRATRRTAQTEELPQSFTARGRVFRRRELAKIRKLTARHASDGRTRISEEVCKALNWRQPNGWLKDRACRDVLRKLECAGLVELPEVKVSRRAPRRAESAARNGTRGRTAQKLIELPGPLELRVAKGNADECEWNRLVQQYHYLGHRVTVGKCMKFLVAAGERIVGAVSLAESAWAVRARDRILEQLGIRRDEVANNSRFLILPNVKIKCLASRVLALLANEGVREWERYYAIPLRCLETFVDSTRFEGTCYRAANWTKVGSTKGYKKTGARHINGQTRKYVYLYPLAAKERNRLRQTIRLSAESGT